MNRTILALSLSLALFVPAAMAVDVALPEVVLQDGADRSIVGFYVLPEDRTQYGGFPVVYADEDLKFFTVEGAVDVVSVRAALDEDVRYVETDASDHQLFLTPTDPLYGDAGHYGVKTTKINLAWDKTVGTTAVRISVIDTGITKTHEDAGGSRILQGYDFINNDNDPNDQGSSCSYHGSHTAGTAAATINNAKGIAGVAQAAINPIKIFKYVNFISCSTSTTAIVNALKWTGDQGDHVSSNSWGGGSSSTAINDAISYSLGKGVTFVGAAGNSGACTNCVGQPWKDNGGKAGVIVVSCSDSADKFCSFSSEGPQVDVIAPGKDILSVAGGTAASYKKMSGTSMSTPHVAGVAGLVKAAFPSETNGGVESRIKTSADSLGLSSDKQGAGRLNGQGAVA